jgi:hypothetical protein
MARPVERRTDRTGEIRQREWLDERYNAGCYATPRSRVRKQHDRNVRLGAARDTNDLRLLLVVETARVEQ